MLQSLVQADEAVFQFFHHWDSFAPAVWQALSVYGVYLIPFILLWFWFARRRETSLFAFLTGLVAWQVVSRVIGHFVPRQRPEDFYHYALVKQEGLFHRPGSSFPSDHTAFMTAIAMIFLLADQPGPAWLVLVIEFFTLLGRVVVGFHWPGDILGGLIVGVVTAYLMWWWRKPIEKYIVNPLVRLAKKVGL